jgi:PD-(D/E)XK nuclease superfamily protein
VAQASRLRHFCWVGKFRTTPRKNSQLLGDNVESGPNRGGKQRSTKRAGRARALPATGKSATGRRRALKNNSKHIGDLAELDFMLQAASHGFAVAKPFGDNEHYDVMIDAGTRIWRVQVKTAIAGFHHRHFQVPSHWMAYKRLAPYTSADIDFLAAFIRRHNIWYLIPAEAIKGRLTFNL